MKPRKPIVEKNLWGQGNIKSFASGGVTEKKVIERGGGFSTVKSAWW